MKPPPSITPVPKTEYTRNKTMRSKHRRWMIFWTFSWWNLLVVCGEELATSTFKAADDTAKDTRGIFSPRMDYDQWKPLGRGDPLKNDPTYDYVPPVLDRVHYWIDPAARKPDPPLPEQSQKTEILLLGVSSKKPSTSVADSRKDTYDSFMKFVDGPKFNHHQRIARPQYHMPYFPPPFYAKNKAQFGKGTEQRVPYTMLMPPPMVTVEPSPPIQQPMTLPQMLMSSVKSTPATTTVAPPTTISSVTVQEANLVYHSSSLGGLRDWKSTTRLTPNPVTTQRIKPFKEEVVFQKHIQPPESYIQIQFAPSQNLSNNILLAANSDQNVNYVTAPTLLHEVMHKGQVTDDNLDISNTYVKIGKPEAQMHTTALDNLAGIGEFSQNPPNLMVFSHVKHPMNTQTPLTMQTLQNMQTLLPPPTTTSPVYKKNPILDALEKEKTTEGPGIETTETNTVTYTTAIPTTTTTSLTTDPLFKHYKQPAEPLKGPLYLIIQGHSKVKTYGPSKQIHGIRVEETNEIGEGSDFHPKHLHGFLKNNESVREARTGNLQTLKHVLQTRLGAIDYSDIEASRRRDNVKETELQFGYEVVEEKDATSEKYHKGIVEEARKLES